MEGDTGEALLKAPLQFQTARLILAAPTAADPDVVFKRYASDPEVTKYLGRPRHQSVVDTRDFLAFSAAESERWPAGPYFDPGALGCPLAGKHGFGIRATGMRR
jgi:RimJ/RimL family protein N-acetyltransferase